jgi:hypothetical protein
MNISDALKRLAPPATHNWSCGDTYESIVWDTKNPTPKPTEAALEAAWLEVVAERDATKYMRDRAPLYNPIGDQLDAIWKQFNQDRLNGKELIQEADDQLNHNLRVKADHPKPAE